MESHVLFCQGFFHSDLTSCFRVLPCCCVCTSCCSAAKSCLTLIPWTAARQAPLPSTISQILPIFVFIESVMLSNHLILCFPLLFLPLIFPSIWVFSNELALVCISSCFLFFFFFLILVASFLLLSSIPLSEYVLFAYPFTCSQSLGLFLVLGYYKWGGHKYSCWFMFSILCSISLPCFTCIRGGIAG